MGFAFKMCFESVVRIACFVELSLCFVVSMRTPEQNTCWSQETYRAHYETFMQLVKTIREMYVDIQKVHETAHATHLQSIKESTNKSRDTAVKCRSIFKGNPLPLKDFLQQSSHGLETLA